MALCFLGMILGGAIGAFINWLRVKLSPKYQAMEWFRHERPDPVVGMCVGAMTGLCLPIVVGSVAILYKAIQ